MTLELTFHPVTAERWADFETLFGERGAYGGCWCMWWRQPNAEWSRATKADRKQAIQEIILSGQIPGILAYAGDRPVGWCSVGPRQSFARLERSRKFASIDDRPTWSVNCFYVEKAYRNQGMMTTLLKAAVDYAFAHGAELVEGYPSTRKEPTAPMNIYTGVTSVFREAGFEEVEREVGGKMVKRWVYRRESK